MEKRAKNVETAIELALTELGITREQADIEIVSEGTKGFFGIGSKEAIVNVTKKETAAEPPLRFNTKPTPVAKTTEKAAAKPVEAEENTGVSDSENCENAKAFLEKIFTAMNLDVAIDVEMSSERNMSIVLDSESAGIIIGKRGDTLDSLQYLTSLVVNRKGGGEYVRVSMDTAQHYRERREQSLKELAASKAERVAKTGKRFTLEPMNPYERRIIHSDLQSNENVTTYSIGQDPYRRVVIAPKGGRRQYRYSSDRRGSRNGYRRSSEGSRRSGNGGYKSNGYHSGRPVSSRTNADNESEPITAEKKGSYTTTYKEDFKPTQHKAQYASFEEYLAAQNNHEN